MMLAELTIYLAGWDQVITGVLGLVVNTAVAIGLAYGARALEGKKKRETLLDEAPTPLATRGSFIPRLIGRHLVAPIVLWAGDRRTTQAGSAPAAKQESAWHALCVGPADVLHKITASGKMIFTGPITPAQYPSGSSFEAVGSTIINGGPPSVLNPGLIENRFYIFWGEEDQPINDYLALAPANAAGTGSVGRVGIASRWPLVCYIVWKNKTLAGTVWDNLLYEIEVYPQPIAVGDPDVGLQDSDSYTLSTSQAGLSFNIRDAADGTPGVGYLIVPGDQTPYLTPNAQVDIAGQPVGPANGLYLVLSSSYAGAFIDSGLILKDFYQAGFPFVWHADPAGATAVPQASPAPPLGLPGQAYRLPAGGAAQAWVHSASTFLPEDEPQRLQVYVSRELFFGFTPTDEITLFFGTSIPSPSTPVREALFTWTGSAWAHQVALADENIQAADVGGNWWLLSYEYSSDATDEGDIRTVGIRVEDAGDAIMAYSPILWETGGTRVLLQEDMTGFAPNQGTITLQTPATYGGGNPAHILAELLFQDWPHGIALPRSLFDIDSLEAVGVYMEDLDEQIFSHVIIDAGESLIQGLSMVLEDVGLFLVWSPEKGAFAFLLVREPGTFENLVFSCAEDDLLEPMPEVETIHYEERPDRITFNYLDRLRNYKTSTIPYDADGSALLHGVAGPTGSNTRMDSVRDFFTAVRVSKRRAAEALASPVRVRLKAARSLRRLPVGTCLEVPNFPLDVFLRVFTSKSEPDSDLVDLECLVDFYAVSPASFSPGDSGGLLQSGPPPLPDIQFDLQEVSRLFTTDDKPRVYFPRVRVMPEILVAGLLLSPTPSGQMQLEANDASVGTGGKLAEDIVAEAWEGPTGFSFQESGPLLTILGPDAGRAENLSSSGFVPLWWAGRQWLQIGREVCYVRELAPLGGNSYQAKGFVRGRLGTEKTEHTTGDKFYIFRYAELPKIEDAGILIPGNAIDAKTRPRVGGVGVDLSLVTAVTATVRGDSVRPMRPDGLRTSTPGSFAWLHNGTLELRWQYRVRGSSGAGLQGAGDPTGQEPYEGTFRLELWSADFTDPAKPVPDVLKAVVVQNYAPPGLLPQFDYLDTDIMADYGGAAPISGSTFKVFILCFNTGGGLDSDSCQALFSKVVT